MRRFFYSFRLNPRLETADFIYLAPTCGVAYTFYMMMDALDGRQARRTKSGSPLGQLFDHGCDSTLAGFLPILISNALGLGLECLPILTSCAQVLFFVGMWEERYTGACRTTVFGLIGTSEYLSLFIFLQLFSGYLPQGNDQVSTLMSVFVLSSSVLGSLVCAWNVFQKTKSITPLLDLLPLFCINLAFQFLPPHESCHQVLSLALVNSYMISLMILSTMTGTDMKALMFVGGTSPLLVVIGLVVLVESAWVSELLNYHLFGFSLFFLWFSVKIIHEIKNHLGISVFSIVPVEIVESKSG